MKSFVRHAKFLFIISQPAFAVLAIIIILGSSLLIYQRTVQVKDSQLGDKLSKNFSLNTDCAAIVNAGQPADLKFDFENKNSQSIGLESLGVDVNLTGADGKTYTKIVKTNPPFENIVEKEKQFTTLSFVNLSIAAKSKKEIILTLQTSSKEEAKASPETIVGYTGNILFSFAHDIITKPTCRIQVRYSK